MATTKSVKVLKRIDSNGNVVYNANNNSSSTKPVSSSSSSSSSASKLNPVTTYGLSNTTLNPDGTSKTGTVSPNVTAGNTSYSASTSSSGTIKPDWNQYANTSTKPTYSTYSDDIGDRPDFDTSSDTDDYKNTLKQVELDRPDDFTSKYTAQIDTLLGQIDNPEAFNLKDNDTYNQLYNNYKESYMNQGQRAMRDTMGQAAALTGGYGSTAAQTAASQSYDNYMSQLNDQNVNLYQMALDDYWKNRNDNYNQLNAYQGQDAVDYGRYRDDVGDWQLDRNYYANQYQNSWNNDYNMYNTDLGQYNNDRNYALNQYQTDLGQYNADNDYALNRYNSDTSQYNTETQLAFDKEQADQAQKNWQTQWDYQLAQDALAAQQKASSGSGGGGSRSSGKSSSKSSGSTSTTSDTYGYVPITAKLNSQLNSTDEKNRISQADAYNSILNYANSQSNATDAEKSAMVAKMVKETGINEDQASAELLNKNALQQAVANDMLKKKNGIYSSLR